jgi:pimeloyl-ACP methyl ester carboxylesterase
MLGRGASAQLSEPSHYRAQAYLSSLMSLMEHFADKRIMVIAKGWGGLLTLLLLRHFKFNLKRLVLADLPLRWDIGQSAQWVAAAQGLAFPSLDHARRSLSALTEFRTLSTAAANAVIDTRVAHSDEGAYKLAFDPKILTAAARYDNQTVDTGPLLHGVNSWMLHLSSDPLSDADRVRLSALLSERPNQDFADGLAVGGRIQFDTAHQRLLTLGFLGTRVMPKGY